MNSDEFYFHDWIEENELEFCEDILKSEDFNTKDILIGLTENDIDRLGSLSLGAKKKILNAVQRLRSSENIYSAKKRTDRKRWNSKLLSKLWLYLGCDKRKYWCRKYSWKSSCWGHFA